MRSKSFKFCLLVLVAVIIQGCGEDCTPLQKELEQVKMELDKRDTMLNQIGQTFANIDSNLLSIREVEAELMLQMRSPKKDKNAIQSNVEKLKGIMEMNQNFIDDLQQNLSVSSATSASLFSIIGSMEEKVIDNNLRLARLNHDLGSLGEDFKGLFDEYMQAEVSKMLMEENLQSMERSVNNMEAQMEELKNHMNTVYIAIGTRRELIASGVLEKGGLLKHSDVNEDLDRMAFKPKDMRTLLEIDLQSAKAKVVTDHPSESYSIKNGKLTIQAPKLFWSISRFLIVVTD